MDARQATDLMSRVAMGEPLSPLEDQSLERWLSEHPRLRETLVENVLIDMALRSMRRDEADDLAFVEQTLRRVELLATAAPPVSHTKPPVGRLGGSVDEGRSTRTRGRSNGPSRSNRASRETLIAIAATVLVVVGIGGLVWLGLVSMRSVQQDSIVVEDDPRPSFDPRLNESLTPVGFASVIRNEGASWSSPLEPGDRLESGVLRLTEGESWIRFDKGTDLHVVGPATLDLRQPDEVYLSQGEVRVAVPQPAIGFTVVTPVGRVVDLGTEFDVSVANSGQTETRVRTGKVVFQPQIPGEAPGAPLELTSGDFDQAISSIPDFSAPALPISTVAMGSQGRFIGMISSGGRTLEFQSADDFNRYQQQVLSEFEAAPFDFARTWTQRVRDSVIARAGPDITPGNVASSGSHSRSISVSVNGRAVSITESSGSGISVRFQEQVDGRWRETTVTAQDRDELRGKSEQAWQLYEQYFGGSE